jgi:hypothetical protein
MSSWVQGEALGFFVRNFYPLVLYSFLSLIWSQFGRRSTGMYRHDRESREIKPTLSRLNEEH